jgi:hypothetical protein
MAAEDVGGILSAIGRGGRIGTQTYLSQMEVERKAAEDAQRLQMALDAQDISTRRATAQDFFRMQEGAEETMRYEAEREEEAKRYQTKIEMEQRKLDMMEEERTARLNKPPTVQNIDAEILEWAIDNMPGFREARARSMIGGTGGMTPAGARAQKQDIVKGKTADVLSAAKKVRSEDIKPPKGDKGGQPISDKDLLEWLKSQSGTIEVDKPYWLTGDKTIQNPYGELGRQAEYWQGSRASDSIQAALQNIGWTPPTEGVDQTLWGGQAGLGPISPTATRRKKSAAELELEQVNKDLGIPPEE